MAWRTMMQLTKYSTNYGRLPKSSDFNSGNLSFFLDHGSRSLYKNFFSTRCAVKGEVSAALSNTFWCILRPTIGDKTCLAGE